MSLGTAVIGFHQHNGVYGGILEGLGFKVVPATAVDQVIEELKRLHDAPLVSVSMDTNLGDISGENFYPGLQVRDYLRENFDSPPAFMTFTGTKGLQTLAMAYEVPTLTKEGDNVLSYYTHLADRLENRSA